MENLKNKIELIIEQSNAEKPQCKNCQSYCDGACVFGSVNERNGYSYRFGNKKITSPTYSCDNFKGTYNFNEKTIDTLSDVLKSIEHVNECKKNLELLLSGKITESDFNDIMA